MAHRTQAESVSSGGFANLSRVDAYAVVGNSEFDRVRRHRATDGDAGGPCVTDGVGDGFASDPIHGQFDVLRRALARIEPGLVVETYRDGATPQDRLLGQEFEGCGQAEVIEDGRA
jgi:hypothetical protein